MPLIFVTGPNGAGKSTICDLLTKQGYKAYDADHDDLAHHYDNATEKLVEYPWDPSIRGVDWHYRHTYKITEERIKQLVSEAQRNVVFLCGITANIFDLQRYFDVSLYLYIDLPLMQQRLAQRNNNRFGKSPDELQFAIETHERILRQCTREHFIKIDATQPPHIVLKDVIRSSQAKT